MAAKLEEHEPTTEWDHGQAFDTLRVYLQGFKKDHLTVHVTSNRTLRVMGDQQNVEKWIRFRTEIPVPQNLDTDKVSARFDDGILYVKFPKAIAPAEPQPKPPTTPLEAPSEPQSQQKDQQQHKTDATPKREKPPKTSEDKKQGKGGNSQKMDEEEKNAEAGEPDEEKKPDMENADDDGRKSQEGDERTKDQRTGKNDSGYHTGGFLERMKQPRILMNSIMAVLLVLMLADHLKHSFKSFRGKR